MVAKRYTKSTNINILKPIYTYKFQKFKRIILQADQECHLVFLHLDNPEIMEYHKLKVRWLLISSVVPTSRHLGTIESHKSKVRRLLISSVVPTSRQSRDHGISQVKGKVAINIICSAHI